MGHARATHLGTLGNGEDSKGGPDRSGPHVALYCRAPGGDVMPAPAGAAQDDIQWRGLHRPASSGENDTRACAKVSAIQYALCGQQRGQLVDVRSGIHPKPHGF